MVREAVTNVVRHADAERCHIELAPGQKHILLRVTDDGVGLGSAGEGNGLRGLRERVSASGAVLLVEPVDAPGPDGPVPEGDTIAASGTRIEVSL